MSYIWDMTRLLSDEFVAWLNRIIMQLKLFELLKNGSFLPQFFNRYFKSLLIMIYLLQITIGFQLIRPTTIIL